MKNSLLIPLAVLVSFVAPGEGWAQATREVNITPRSVVNLDAKLRFTTMIILPDGEEILDIICGDKDFWIVSGTQNFAYIKPAKAGASTNLNIVTNSGAVYSFVVTEGAASPDLKVLVSSDASATATRPRQRLYSAAEVDQLRREIEAVKAAGETARQASEEERASVARALDESSSRFKATYPTTLQFPYRFAVRNTPSFVAAIYHDGQSTFIRLNKGQEIPAVYELQDGAASLVNVQVENDTLIVPKVLRIGYLAVGKQRFVFSQRGPARER